MGPAPRRSSSDSGLVLISQAQERAVLGISIKAERVMHHFQRLFAAILWDQTGDPNLAGRDVQVVELLLPPLGAALGVPSLA